MKTDTQRSIEGSEMRYQSDFVAVRKASENLDFSQAGQARCGARQSASAEPGPSGTNSVPELGIAMTISEVAKLLGCSAWTVRQRFIPQGLPCLRASRTGKFVFFREQVIRWILRRQKLMGGSAAGL